MLKCIFCYLAGFCFLFLSCVSFGQESCDTYSIYFYDKSDASWVDDVTFAEAPQKTISKLTCHCTDQSSDEIKSAVEHDKTPLEVKVCKTSKIISGMTAKEALDNCSDACSQYAKYHYPALF